MGGDLRSEGLIGAQRARTAWTRRAPAASSSTSPPPIRRPSGVSVGRGAVPPSPACTPPEGVATALTALTCWLVVLKVTVLPWAVCLVVFLPWAVCLVVFFSVAL